MAVSITSWVELIVQLAALAVPLVQAYSVAVAVEMGSVLLIS